MYKITLYSFSLFFMIGCGTTSTPSTSIITPHTFEAPSIDSTEKQLYLDAINAARAVEQNCGSEGVKSATNPLVWSDALYKASYEHSYDLAQSNTFSHQGSATDADWTAQVQNLGKGSTFKERIENNGYTNWKYIGENIAAHTTYDTAEKAVAAWIKSAGHCASLMNPNFTEVGMGHVEEPGTTHTHYWTQNFGSKQ